MSDSPDIDDFQVSRRHKKRSQPPSFSETSSRIQPKKGIQRDEQQSTYLIIKNSDPLKNISSLNPFALHSTLKNKLGRQPESLRKLNNGTFLVEVDTEEQADILLKITEIQSEPVKIFKHPTLNNSTGVLRCTTFKGMSDKDILEQLTNQGIVEVKCLTKKASEVNGPLTYLLSFSDSKPAFIDILGYKHPIISYFQKPLRCFKCNLYGHTNQVNSPCRRMHACPRCSTSYKEKCDHDEVNCSKPPKCIACSGDHDVRSSQCPVYRREIKIFRYAALSQISIAQARQEYSNEITGNNRPPFFSTQQPRQSPVQHKVVDKPYGRQDWPPLPTSRRIATQDVLRQKPMYLTTTYNQPTNLTWPIDATHGSSNQLTQKPPTSQPQSSQKPMPCTTCETMMPTLQMLLHKMTALTESLQQVMMVLMENKVNDNSQSSVIQKVNKNKASKTPKLNTETPTIVAETPKKTSKKQVSRSEAETRPIHPQGANITSSPDPLSASDVTYDLPSKDTGKINETSGSPFPIEEY